MTSPILVTGGTGTLGTHVVDRLRGRGAPVRVFSRTEHAGDDAAQYIVGDLTTGRGVQGALAGVDVIVHCARPTPTPSC
jgi:nucleoside-diphosphate-sugar epimerase